MTELSREEVLRIAKECFHGKQYEAVTYESGPYDIDYPTSDLLRFAAAIYEAGAKSERTVSDRLLEALKFWKIAADNAEECEFDEMAAFSIPMPLFCDADEATDAAIAEIEATRKEKPE